MQQDLTANRHIAAGGDLRVGGNATVGRNLRVEGWLDAPNIKGPLKGLFASPEALQQAWPRPEPGWFALTGDTLPARVYRCDNGRWQQCGVTEADFTLDAAEIRRVAQTADELQITVGANHDQLLDLLDDERGERQSDTARLDAEDSRLRQQMETSVTALGQRLEQTSAALGQQLATVGTEAAAALAAVDGVTPESWTQEDFTSPGKFINSTTGAVTPDAGFSLLTVTASPGETFAVCTVAGNNGRAWNWLDAGGKIVEACPTGGAFDGEITAPAGTVRLAVNCRQSDYGRFLVVREPASACASLPDRFAALEKSIDGTLAPLSARVEALEQGRGDGTDWLAGMADVELATGFEPVNYNTARIVADTRMEFHNGDVLRGVTVRFGGTPAGNTVPTQVFVYSASGQLLASRELGTVTQPGATTFTLEGEGIPLEAGCRVAVKGTGYTSLTDGTVFHDYNSDSDLTAYAYTFALTVSRRVVAAEALHPSVKAALQQASALSGRVAEVEKTTRKTFKMVCFGNSFTQDACCYVPWILQNLAPGLELTLDLCCIDSCRMAQHCASMTGQSTELGGVTLQPKTYTVSHYEPGMAIWKSRNGVSAQEIITSQDWDLVTFQQNGSDSFKDYDTYFAPFVGPTLLAAARCAGRAVRFGWLLTHGSYSADAAELRQRWQGTADNARRVAQRTPVSVVIPYGTAVENLRTRLDCADTPGLLADGMHLQEGIGCLAAAYTVAMTVMRLAGMEPTVAGDTTRPDKAWTRSHDIQGANYGQSDTVCGITEANCWLAQCAAHAAMDNPYELNYQL